MQTAAPKITSYKELIVWQKSVLLVSEIYAITSSFPLNERHGITTEVNRAALSIPANIAEGWGRGSTRGFLSFLQIARGALMELETLLVISTGLKFLYENIPDNIEKLMVEISKMLNALIRKTELMSAKK